MPRAAQPRTSRPASTRPSSDPPSLATPAEREFVHTLLDLARQVRSVLDFDELLSRLPAPISRLISYQALAVYLPDEKQGDLPVVYAVGYPAGAVGTVRLLVGQGLVGAAVAEQRSIVMKNVLEDARHVEIVPGMASEVVVPLIHKAVAGARDGGSQAVGQRDLRRDRGVSRRPTK